MRSSMAIALAIFLLPTDLSAESWCADPLWVHEWGVHVFGGGEAEEMPSFFHDVPPSEATVVAHPVRDLPRDYGERELPVLQFYTAGMWDPPFPAAVELGFSQGESSGFGRVGEHRFNNDRRMKAS